MLQKKDQKQQPLSNTFVNILITTEKADKIIAQKYYNGQNQISIAKEMGLKRRMINNSVIKQNLKPYQVQLKNKKTVQEDQFSEQQKEEILNHLKECNFDYVKISRQYNVPFQQIQSWVRTIKNREQLEDVEVPEKQLDSNKYEKGLNMLQNNYSIGQVSRKLKITVEKAKRIYQDQKLNFEF